MTNFDDDHPGLKGKGISSRRFVEGSPHNEYGRMQKYFSYAEDDVAATQIDKTLIEKHVSDAMKIIHEIRGQIKEHALTEDGPIDLRAIHEDLYKAIETLQRLLQ